MTLDLLLSMLVGLWAFDIQVFSNPWMYIPMFVPVCFYAVFFILKWTFLTAPVWLPVVIIIKALKGGKSA